MRQVCSGQLTRNKHHAKKGIHQRYSDQESYQVSQVWRNLMRAKKQRSKLKRCIDRQERKVNLDHKKRTMPARSWEKAKPGTVSEYAGILSQEISSLSEITENEIDEVIDDIRERE
jgi:hypothetical protein